LDEHLDVLEEKEAEVEGQERLPIFLGMLMANAISSKLQSTILEVSFLEFDSDLPSPEKNFPDDPLANPFL
jgi:hypothetical protein